MLAFLQNAVLGIVPYALVLGMIVIIHELGHFLVAKALGTKIDQFSIGFGAAIFSRTDRSGVQWRVGWIPLGGYVKFAGDENVASVPDEADLAALRYEVVQAEGEGAVSRYFHLKPLWQRALITVAGPMANFILAIVIFAGLLMALGEPIAPSRVDMIKPGSPAARAGFQLGDVIETADGQRLRNFYDLQLIILLKSGTPVEFVVSRAGHDVPLIATPERGVIVDQFGHSHQLGVLGIGYNARPGDMRIQRYGPLQAIGRGAEQSWTRIATTIQYLGRLFAGLENADQVQGPIGMAQISHDITSKMAQGSPTVGVFLLNEVLNMLQFAASISVGIGFLNLLPVPVLDGGHLLFYGYEAVARRPLAAKVQAAGYRVGLALVLGLMLFATWNDLQRLRVFKIFGDLFS